MSGAMRTLSALARPFRALGRRSGVTPPTAEELQVMLKARAARRSVQGWEELDRAIVRMHMPGGGAPLL